MYKINFKAIAAMFKAIDGKKVAASIAGFAQRNEGTLVYGLGALGLGALAKKYRIPIGDVANVYANKGKILDFDDLRGIGSPKDAAISALTKSGCDTYYSSEKIQAINGIKDLIMADANTDKSTSSYAVRCLEKLADTTYLSEVKKEAQNAILEIGKRG